MNRTTGRRIEGLAHLHQSIADILTTPPGSRVMRREYGSLLPELIDQPDNGTTRVRIFAATAAALMRWEPRLRVSRIQIETGTRPGQVVMGIAGTYTPGNAHRQEIDLQLTLQMRAV
jgi:phage baseplate assembly protein W